MADTTACRFTDDLRLRRFAGGDTCDIPSPVAATLQDVGMAGSSSSLAADAAGNPCFFISGTFLSVVGCWPVLAITFSGVSVQPVSAGTVVNTDSVLGLAVVGVDTCTAGSFSVS